MTPLQTPPPEALSRAADALGTTHARRAAEKITHVVLVGGCLMVTGSKGDLYTVALDGSACNCPAFGECWHMAAVKVIELALAHPAGIAPPTVQESIDRAARALDLNTMPRLTKSYSTALQEINELF